MQPPSTRLRIILLLLGCGLAPGPAFAQAPYFQGQTIRPDGLSIGVDGGGLDKKMAHQRPLPPR